MVHDNKTIDHEGFLLANSYFNKIAITGFTGKVKWPDGDKFWYKDGMIHREDGPAIVHADGTKRWYKNNNAHREDGPAVEYSDGSVEWWYAGKKGLENFPPEIKKKLARRFLHGT